jgi:uroporphyrinogen decarboxylase
MDSADLKREFGKDLTFWEVGSILRVPSTNPTLLRKCTRMFATGWMTYAGGVCISTVHNIQGNVPPENIMAMWETVQKYGRY